MTIVKISALRVVADAGLKLVRQAAAQAEAAAGQDGFEGCELLEPADERTTWLIVSRWRDEEACQAWLSWRRAREPRPVARQVGDAARPAVRTARPATISPVAYSEQWSYEVAGGSAGTPGNVNG
jgi:heme oxygenase (mycobilin-producing)